MYTYIHIFLYVLYNLSLYIYIYMYVCMHIYIYTHVYNGLTPSQNTPLLRGPRRPPDRGRRRRPGGFMWGLLLV